VEVLHRFLIETIGDNPLALTLQIIIGEKGSRQALRTATLPVFGQAGDVGVELPLNQVKRQLSVRNLTHLYCTVDVKSSMVIFSQRHF